MIKRSSKVEVPLDAIDGNIIFDGQRAAAVHRVDTKSFGLATLADKQSLHGKLFWWMLHAEADFSIYRVCREYSAEQYVSDTINLIDERFADRGRCEQMLDMHAKKIASMRSFVPEAYFATALNTRSLVPWSRSRQDNAAVRAAEESALATLTSHLSARRAKTLELQWLLRRAPTRGINEPDLDPYWSPAALEIKDGVWAPGRADVQSFMPTVTERGRSVLVEGEDGDSLQTFLVMGSPPRTTNFPGSAELLFAPLEKLDFPVDVVAHVKRLSNKKMLSKGDDAIKDSRDELEDAASRFLNRKIRRRSQEVEDVLDYFETEPFPPAFDTFICFSVSAPVGEHKLLADRVEALKQVYRPTRLYQPHGLQRYLFEEHFLRPNGSDTKDYRRDYNRLLIGEQLAAMMPIGTNEGGSSRGFYIGYTIPGAARPVKYSMLEASGINRAGAVELNGTLGSGKTISVQTLAYQAERRGSLVFGIDPKKPAPDHSLERWPGMEGRVDELLISNDNIEQYGGALDPLISALPEMAEELMVTYAMGILPHATVEWQTEIIEATRAVMREPDPCSWKVIDYLLASEDQHAYTAGKALRARADMGLARFVFSRGGKRDLDARRPVTMVKAPALNLPMAGTDPDSYDEAERISVATFKLIIAFGMRVLSSVDRTVNKFLVIDEAHVLTTNRDGRRFLEMLIRMGRFMNITVALATQLAGDLAELNQLIGVRMVFRQETVEQAKINLKALGLDPEDKHLIEMLTEQFKDGMCLFRGLDKRVIAMQFDTVDPEILRVASTRPDDDISNLEEALLA